MTRSALTAIVLVSSFAPGCLTASDFDLARPVPEQALVGSTVPVPLPDAFPLSFSLDLSEALGHLPHADLVEIKLAAFTLTVTSAKQPAGDVDNFAFLDTLRVYATGTTLPRVEIAHARAHGATPTLEFGVADDLDLTPYLFEATTINAIGTGMLPTDDISFDGTIVFHIHPM
ncbi:MAG: hypothetical protein IPQ07_01790 [Myxococcales bacterium]|nr:hypothetical protein [Myxococcales bacterium]